MKKAKMLQDRMGNTPLIAKAI